MTSSITDTKPMTITKLSTVKLFIPTCTYKPKFSVPLLKQDKNESVLQKHKLSFSFFLLILTVRSVNPLIASYPAHCAKLKKNILLHCMH